jgi:hypothetical protein
MQNIEEEIINLKLRNKKVDLDKKWETSLTRKSVVALLTYCSMIILMSVLKTQNPFLDAIIPTLGYLLSTLSLGFVKNRWIKSNLIK